MQTTFKESASLLAIIQAHREIRAMTKTMLSHWEPNK